MEISEIDLEPYRVNKKIALIPPIECTVWRRDSNKKKGSPDEFIKVEVKLLHTSALSWDNTISFICEAKNGEKFATNEKNII